MQIIHRGKYKSLTTLQRKWLKRRQAVEPLIGHTKSDHGVQRCWLEGALGDALHALSCAAGYNIRWLLRAIAGKTAKDAKAFLLALWGWRWRRAWRQVGRFTCSLTLWNCGLKPGDVWSVQDWRNSPRSVRFGLSERDFAGPTS